MTGTDGADVPGVPNVPDVLGCPLAEARRKLAGFPLEVRVTGPDLDHGVALVVRQRRLPGEKVELVVAFWPAPAGNEELVDH